MSQTHTIAVRFPEGVVPRYSAATEFKGGQVVAVSFGGNRLAVEQELEEALDALLTNQHVWDAMPNACKAAEAVLAKARGKS